MEGVTFGSFANERYVVGRGLCRLLFSIVCGVVCFGIKFSNETASKEAHVRLRLWFGHILLNFILGFGSGSKSEPVRCSRSVFLQLIV